MKTFHSNKLIILIFFIISPYAETSESDILEVVMPLVDTNNFSGNILISKNGTVQFEQSFGFANIKAGIKNNKNTKFFLASVSMVFTSTAVLKLHQEGVINIDDKIGKYIPKYTIGKDIKIIDLLKQRSGIPRIQGNEHISYDELTTQEHSAESLFNHFKDLHLDFAPGSTYSHSRSDYILLALLVEKVSGLSFGEYLKRNVFMPLKMNDTGHYDSDRTIPANLSTGYAAEGLYGLTTADRINWSSKTGHASIYSTADDLNKFGVAVSENKLLNQDLWQVIFTDYGNKVGLGWFISPHESRARYQMNGRSPGYTSYFAVYPEEKLVVTVLSNLYISVPAEIGKPLASIIFAEDHAFKTIENQSFKAEGIEQYEGSYQFGENFYVPNFRLSISKEQGHLNSQWGWLLPIKDHHSKFRLRNYWSDVEFIFNPENDSFDVLYDGFVGKRVINSNQGNKHD